MTSTGRALPPRYSVVIPVYNSALTVAATMARTIAFFHRHDWSCEIIAVNDGSTDRSWEVVRDVARTSTCVTAIDLASNSGQHTATFCGLARATGEFVVTLDDDLQHPPEEIARLIEKAAEGHDFVCGRFRQDRGSLRRLGSWAIGLIDRWLFHTPRGFVFTSFRLMRRDVVTRLCAYGLRDPYLRGLLVLCASSPANVWVEHRPRLTGRSGYDLVKIARFGVRILRTYRDLGRARSHPQPLAAEIREVVGVSAAASEVK